MVEEDDLRDCESLKKVRETGGIGMIIGGILCLFLLRKFHILLAPLYFSPLHGRVTCKSRKQAEAQLQVWDFHQGQ